jgi:threonine/homoserine/homoserine lactone efflux protein
VAEAVGSVLPLAIAIAIFPVPIIAAVLLVGSERGILKGLTFALAWAAGLAAVGAIVLVAGGVADASDDGEPATWMSVLLLVLGVVLLWLAIKQWRARPKPGEAPGAPGWMRAIDDFTTLKAGSTGFALAALNPKNLLLAVAAAAEIAEFGLPVGQQVGVLAGFVLLASVGVLTPVVLSIVLGDRAQNVLGGLRDWLAQNNAVIMSVLFVLIGAKLIGDGIAGL